MMRLLRLLRFGCEKAILRLLVVILVVQGVQAEI